MRPSRVATAEGLCAGQLPTCSPANVYSSTLKRTAATVVITVTWHRSGKMVRKRSVCSPVVLSVADQQPLEVRVDREGVRQRKLSRFGARAPPRLDVPAVARQAVHRRVAVPIAARTRISHQPERASQL